MKIYSIYQMIELADINEIKALDKIKTSMIFCCLQMIEEYNKEQLNTNEMYDYIRLISLAASTSSLIELAKQLEAQQTMIFNEECENLQIACYDANNQTVSYRKQQHDNEYIAHTDETIEIDSIDDIDIIKQALLKIVANDFFCCLEDDYRENFYSFTKYLQMYKKSFDLAQNSDDKEQLIKEYYSYTN